MKIQRLTLAIILCLGLCLSSCAPQYIVKVLKKDLDLRGEITRHTPPADLEAFSGIEDWLEEGDTVNVLLIPGMRSKEWSNYNNLINNITSRLSMNFEDMEHKLTFSGFEDKRLLPGEITVLRFGRKYPIGSGEIKEQKLNFYFVNWTKITQKAKDDLVGFEEQMNHLFQEPVLRTYFSNKIKNEYFIDIFADLALYRQPDYNQAIQNSVQEALLEIKREKTGKKPLLFITGSMGSEVATDALFRLFKFQELHKELFESISSLHMSNETKLEANRQAIFRGGNQRQSTFKANNYLDDLENLKRQLIDRLSGEEEEIQVYLKNEMTHVINEVKDLLENSPFELENAQDLLQVWCASYSRRHLLSQDFSPNLKQVFMLNNQLVFTSILDYSTEDFEKSVTLEEKVVDRFDKFIKLYNSLGWAKNPQELKIISFYDPNDLFGFQLPEESTKQVSLINIPISHATRWTINGQRFKRDYLYRLPVGDLKDQLSYEIGEEAKFNVLSNLEGPSEAAKNNQDVFNYILEGHKIHPLAQSERRMLEEEEALATQKDKKRNRDDIRWKKNKSLNKEKNVLKPRLAWAAFKVSKVIRSVELPYTSPPEVDIPGIRGCLSEHDTVHILTVHGMGSKNSDHFDGMAQQLATQMGFVSDFTDNPIETFETEIGLKYSVRKMTFKDGENKRLIFTIIHWSPITKPIKKQLLDLSRKASDNREIFNSDKSFVHRTLKEKIIIDGFVDVNLSLGTGNFLEQMSKAVGKGMENIIEMEKGHLNRKNVFFITGSLGSKVMYEHITHSLENPDTQLLTQQLMKKAIRWYMLTNQIPMIGLKEMNEVNRDSLYKNQVWHSWEKLYEKGLLPKEPFEIVSFHDPNDILTFMIPPIHKEHRPYFKLYNLPMRTGDGIELDIFEAYKFLKRVDRRLYQILDGEKKTLRREKREALAGELSLLKAIQKKLEVDSTKQRELALLEQWEEELEEVVKMNKRIEHNPLLIPALLETYDLGVKGKKAKFVSQPYMLRFDAAHDKVKNNKRILDVIAEGTPASRR